MMNGSTFKGSNCRLPFSGLPPFAMWAKFKRKEFALVGAKSVLQEYSPFGRVSLSRKAQQLGSYKKLSPCNNGSIPLHLKVLLTELCSCRHGGQG